MAIRNTEEGILSIELSFIVYHFVSLNYWHLSSPLILSLEYLTRDFPGGSVSKESACDAGELGSIPGSGRAPGKGNGNPLQDSCLGNPVDRGAWWATVHGDHESQTRLRD